MHPQPGTIQQAASGLHASPPSQNLDGSCPRSLAHSQLLGQAGVPLTQPTTVVLLKHPTPCLIQDPWAIKLRALSYEPVYLPILEFSFDRVNELAEILEQGPAERWAGVVVTSARSAEALQEAIDHLPTLALTPSSDWSSVPFFAVGSATARALHQLQAPPSSPSPPLGGLSVLGENEAGSGELLGSFIVRYFRAGFPQSTPPLPLLYLTGAHQRPELSRVLSSAQPPIPFVELQVYTARPIVQPTPQPPLSTPPRWVVFFSPNSASLAIPRLQELLNANTTSGLRYAAIGPSTRDALVSLLGRPPDVVALRPQPDSLLDAIRQVENESQPSDTIPPPPAWRPCV